jgi:hypothetical protein
VENLETSHAVPDGILLSEWQAQNQLGQTTVYELLKLIRMMGIELEKVKLTGTKPVTLLTGKSLQAMDNLLAQHLSGKSLPALRAEIGIQAEMSRQSAIDNTVKHHALVEASKGALTVNDEPTGSLNVAELLKRLEAANLAQTTGLPLSKSEVEWVMGNKLDSETVKLARCTIEKRGTKWSLFAPLG